MVFLKSLDIVGSALTAERYRADVVLQNISNARTTRTPAGGPYHRKQVVYVEKPFQQVSFRESLLHFKSKLHVSDKQVNTGGVRVQSMFDSINEFKKVYDPEHPDADADGYVTYPNVDTTEEMTDLMEASNAYDLNLTAMSVVKAMISKSLDIAK